MEGLSPDKIRVLLHPIQEQARSFRVDGHVLSLDGVDHGADVVLWESGDSTNGLWRAAEVVYTSRQPHQVNQNSYFLYDFNENYDIDSPLTSS